MAPDSRTRGRGTPWRGSAWRPVWLLLVVWLLPWPAEASPGTGSNGTGRKRLSTPPSPTRHSQPAGVPATAAALREPATESALLAAEVARLRQELNAVQKRLEQPGTQLQRLERSQGMTEALLATRAEERKRQTHVYGIVNQAFLDDGLPGKPASFDNAELYLMLQSRIDRRWSTWAELEFEHTPEYEAGTAGQGEIRVDRAFVNYKANGSLNLQLGQLFTPWGLWCKVHWRQRVPTWTRPLSLERELLPVKAVGLDAFGTLDRARNSSYSVFVFNDKAVGQDGLDLNGNKWILGDLTRRLGSNWEVGVSAAEGRNAAKGGRFEKVAMVYGQGYLDRQRRVQLWVEALRLTSAPVQTTDAWAGLQWEFTRKYFLGFREDVLTRDEKAGNLRHTEHVGYLNYKPNVDTIVGLEVVRHEFEDPGSPGHTSALVRVGAMFGGL